MKYTFDVIAQINDNFESFSQAEEKLAQYVLANPNAVINLSITELAENCGVSISTISRFCRHLTLNGYQDFRLELMRSASNASADASENSDITSQDSTPQMVQKLSNYYLQAINKLSTNIDYDAFLRICDMIDEAETVHFSGSGNMLPVASTAQLQFLHVSTKFRCEVDAGAQVLAASLMSEKDLLIVFAHSGENIAAIDVAKFAKKNNAKVVAITRYSQSTLAGIADELLICNVSKGVHQYSSLPLCMGMQYLTDLLYTEYCRRHPKTSAENNEKTILAIIGKA